MPYLVAFYDLPHTIIYFPCYISSMKPEGKGYILKEYGSWSVLTVAFLIGLGVTRELPWQALPLFIALGLLVNSKQALHEVDATAVAAGSTSASFSGRLQPHP